MPKFTVEIECDSAAFVEDLPGQITEILRRLADRTEEGVLSGTIRDVNGNTVGRFALDVEED